MTSSTPPLGSTIPNSFYQEFLEDENNFNESNYPLEISFKAAAVHLLQANLLKLGSLAIVHPFESLRVLRQVQYGTAVDVSEEGGFFDAQNLPSNNNSIRPEFAESGTSNDADDEADGLFMKRSSRTFDSEAHSADSYYTSSALKSSSQNLLTVPAKEIDVDDAGYAKPRSSKTSNSSWPIIFNKKASLWSSCMLVSKYQGIPSLWQGFTAFWAYQSVGDITQTALEELLTSPVIWNRPGGLLRYEYSAPGSNHFQELVKTFPGIPVTASVLFSASVNFLLTPLDIIRTRLVCQSIYKPEIKHNSIISSLKSVYQEEGGISGLYPNSIFNGISSVLISCLRIVPISIFNHFIDPLMESFGIPSGISYAVAQFLTSCANTAVSLPLETIRRRLHLQTGKKISKRWIYRVPISTVQYTGFWNCLRRICQEEGVSALYQGWSMQLASSTVVLASNVLLQIDHEKSEDLETF